MSAQPRLKYSDITPELYAGLRIVAAFEACYPKEGDMATRTLAGYAEWRRRIGFRTPPNDEEFPGGTNG